MRDDRLVPVLAGLTRPFARPSVMGQACSCLSMEDTEPPAQSHNPPSAPSSSAALQKQASRLSSSPAALSKKLYSSKSADDVAATAFDDMQHDIAKESIKHAPLSASTSSILVSPPAPHDQHLATTLSPLPSMDDSTTTSSMAPAVSVNPISTTQQTYSSTRLTISTASQSNTVLPSVTSQQPIDLRRHVSLGSGHEAATEDTDESVDEDIVVVTTAGRLGRQDSLDGDGYVEVQEDIVDVTDCLDSLDLSLDTEAPPTTAYNVRISPTAGDELVAVERNGSMSLPAHGSVTQQRLQMAIPSNTPSPSPRMTPSPTHSQGSAFGSMENTQEGGVRLLDEGNISLNGIVVLPPATALLSGGSSSSALYSSAATASSLAGSSTASSVSSIPGPVAASRTTSGSFSSPFLTVPPLATIPYIHPSAPPVSGSPPPTSPFLSPPSPQHHRHHHRHHLTNSPTRRRKSRTVIPQPSSPTTLPLALSPHRHSEADLPSLSPSSLSSSSSSSSLLTRAQTIETSHVSTSYNENGQKQINQYVVEGGELGSGTSGEVKLVFSLTDQKYYAMKEVSKSKAKKKRLKRKDQQDMWEQLKREIAIMKKVDHRNVVRLVEVMDDPHNDRLYMVMEYVEHGHVGSSEMPEPIPLHLVKQYMRDALLGLDYLHYHNIIHRDIKPDNLLLSATGECKIGDLGMSTVLSSTQELLHEYSAGTPAYRPPEMCQGQGFSGQAADVWSLGVTMYFLLYAQLPFWGSSEMLLAQSIIDKELVFPDDEEAQTVEPVDDGCKHFIARMLEKDPRERVSVEDMLRDDWLVDGGQWRPDRSWREREEAERRRKAREERRAARGGTADGKESDEDDDGTLGASRHEIIVTPAEVSESITVVSRLLLMVKLKRKMRKHRRALGARARSVSLDDRMQDRLGHFVPHSTSDRHHTHKDKAVAGNGPTPPAMSRWAALSNSSPLSAALSASASHPSPFPRPLLKNSRSVEDVAVEEADTVAEVIISLERRTDN